MKKWPVLVLALTGLSLAGGIILLVKRETPLVSPLVNLSFLEINYAPYSFENLRKREYYQSQIKLEKKFKEEKAFTPYLFSFSADGRKITGLANIPNKEDQFPVAILIRGWVDEEVYQTGMGTKKMADFLAENGFLALAPDLLGYGGSDSAFNDILLTRFFRPVTIISLIESLNSLPQAEADKLVIWGHSNGGQIALSVLEITGEEIPASLWAPVAAGFPESVLYFAKEMEDGGEKLKETIAEFEKEYNPEEFSVMNFLDQIDGPLIIHQGMADESIPPKWTDNLVGQLRSLDKEITYHQYSGENHNFTRGQASELRKRDLEFFQKNLGVDNNP